MIRGMLAGLYGETSPQLRGEPARRRRPLRRPRLSRRRGARLPRPRVVVAAATRRARGDAPVPARAPRRPGPPPRRGPRHPGRGRGRARAGGGAVRRPTARGRVHLHRHRGGEHRGLGCGRTGPRGDGGGTSSPPRSSTRRCSRRARAARPTTSPSSASTAPAGSTPTTSLDAVRADTALVSVQLANHEVGTLQTAVAEIVAGARERGIVVHVDACAAAGHVPVDFAALDADLCSVDRPQVRRPEGRGRAAGAARAAVPAVRRRRRAGARPARRASRTCPRSSASAPRRPSSPTTGWRGRPQRRAALTDALAAAATVGRPASTASATPSARLPHLVCLGIDGVEAEPILLGARPARRRRALRVVVLERVARAVAGARGDGRRRRPLAARQRRLVAAPTPTSSVRPGVPRGRRTTPGPPRR